ncbi:hypothetical protein ACJJTC_001102 [Scirpophaga incertulas]
MWVPNLPVTLTSALAAGIGVACIIKDTFGGPPYDKTVRAEGQTVIITGANEGIGRETANDLAKRGAKTKVFEINVIPDFLKKKGPIEIPSARRRGGTSCPRRATSTVYCRPCDLASLDSVRQFVERFKSEEPHVDVLVANAAVMHPPKVPTRDGFEQQLGVNHLGHFLLTNLLMDHLKAAPRGRVVVVACGEHRRGVVRREDLNHSAQYDAAAAYAQSKLANVLFATELTRQTLGSSVSVVVVDPGLTDSRLTRHLAPWRSAGRLLVYPLFWLFMKSPASAAHSVLHAALAPDLARGAGGYYLNMKKVEPSKESQDFELAHWLWVVSEKWTRLDEHKAKVAAA